MSSYLNYFSQLVVSVTRKLSTRATCIHWSGGSAYNKRLQYAGIDMEPSINVDAIPGNKPGTIAAQIRRQVANLVAGPPPVHRSAGETHSIDGCFTNSGAHLIPPFAGDEAWNDRVYSNLLRRKSGRVPSHHVLQSGLCLAHKEVPRAGRKIIVATRSGECNEAASALHVADAFFHQSYERFRVKVLIEVQLIEVFDTVAVTFTSFAVAGCGKTVL
mmetsp:Transcript_2956/g.5228  ORF Transcript_2956/g.5228 Transcript_2956/m.5228 type:complete len:216 (-) Transcript_2956:323-970(-)